MSIEAPVTQKELLQAQLDNQERLYEAVGRVEQKVNEGFAEVKDDIAQLAERMARMEGEGESESREESHRSGRVSQVLYGLGIIVSFFMAAIAMIVTLMH